MSAEMRKADSIHASNSFESLFWGDPGVTLDSVREEYKAVIQHEAQRRRPSYWIHFPIEVARCAILGINPVIGDDLLSPDEYVASYKSAHPADSKTVSEFYNRMKDNPHIKQLLEVI